MISSAFRFEVEALPDAQTLPRLINYFAQLGLTPSFVQAEVKGATMRVAIEQRLPNPAHAKIIAEKMRTSFLVDSLVLHISPDVLEN